MNYDISAVGYLKRAKQALERRDHRYLFYAAFELRCCVETRQGEYAEALSAYQKVKIKPWNVKETGKRIRRSSYADRIALCRYHFGEKSIDSYHTPVPDKLIKFVDAGLGKLLHCQRDYQTLTDEKWEQIKSDLVDGYRMAWLSCQGDSMVPPMFDKNSNKVHPFLIEKNDRNSKLFDLLPLLSGVQFTMEIAYPPEPPANWVCDL